MMTVRQKSLKRSAQAPEVLVEKRIEAERMRDILLLLQNLVNSQEATAKLILDCLYDIASINLINQRLGWHPLNKVMKLIARTSKPIFRIYALRWFKKNCPQLIATWLHSQVAFTSKPQEVVIEVSQTKPSSVSRTENLVREIKHLRHQIRWLSGVTVITLVALSVTVVQVNRSQESLGSSKFPPNHSVISNN